MTIYALSSGPGLSGIAVIRISGQETSNVIKLLTGKPVPKPINKAVCKSICITRFRPFRARYEAKAAAIIAIKTGTQRRAAAILSSW